MLEYFNPIIVLFLTRECPNRIVLQKYFNPIIVLFLTRFLQHRKLVCFQHFNPIIVLFLTLNGETAFTNDLEFQSYYSLISNTVTVLNLKDS